MSGVPSGLSGAWRDFGHHFRVLEARTIAQKLKVVLTHRPLWALATYRLGRSIYFCPIGVIRAAGMAAYLPARAVIRRLTMVALATNVDVGERVFIGKGVAVIAEETVIGEDCMLLGGNTLGVAGRGALRGVPRIGSRCVLRQGAVIIGKIELPDGTVVGENAVVAKSPQIGERLEDVHFPPVPEVPPSVKLPRESFWPAFKTDVRRLVLHFQDGIRLSDLFAILLNDGLWALAAYRFGRAVGGGLWYRLFERMVRAASGIRLDLGAKIAPGLYIGHFGEIEVGAGVKIGTGCNISQRCRLYSTADGAPVLGDRIYVGAGAWVRGGLNVGNDVAVGANSLVERDVPEGSVVVGVPARVISHRGSTDFILDHEFLSTNARAGASDSA